MHSNHVVPLMFLRYRRSTVIIIIWYMQDVKAPQGNAEEFNASYERNTIHVMF